MDRPAKKRKKKQVESTAEGKEEVSWWTDRVGP